jgi:hypothetical protein
MKRNEGVSGAAALTELAISAPTSIPIAVIITLRGPLVVAHERR